MSAGQIAKAQISNSNPHQMLHFVADAVKHPPDLLIEPLTQDDAQSSRTNRMETRNARPLAVENYSAQKLWRERSIPNPPQSDFVLFFHFVTRMSEALGEVAIICQEQQAFTLGIQTSDVKEPRKFWRQ